MKSKHRNIHRAWLRRLSTLLAVAMLALALPVSALAEELNADDAAAPAADALESSFGYDGDEPDEAPAEIENSGELPAYELDDSDSGDETGEEPVDDGEAPQSKEDEIVIVGFDPEDVGTFKLTQKPTDEMVRANLPSTVYAYIADLEDPVEINVDWQCEGFDEQDYGTFEFTARFADETVEIGGAEVKAEDIVFKKGVRLPRAHVEVVYITGFEAMEKSVYQLDAQPESADEAVEAMELPDTVYATMSDSNREKAFSVTWKCDNYDDSAAEQYVFSAEFSGADFALQDGVLMPEVALEIAGDAKTAAQVQEKFTYVVTEKPESVQAAIETMGLSNYISVKFPGDRTATILEVTWDCASYALPNRNEFTFTPTAVDPSAMKSDDVELPDVVMTVIVSQEFTLAVNEDDTLTITGWKKTGEKLVIPEQIGGYEEFPVTAIGAGAFADHTELQSVTISPGIQKIGDGAFAGCTGLTGIIFPDTLTEVGDGVLTGAGTPSHVGLCVSATTTMTGAGVFSNSAGKTVTLPLAVTDIEVMDLDEDSGKGGGKLTLKCDFTVGEGHSLEVYEDGYALIASGVTVTNEDSDNGICVDIGGQLVNKGTIVNHGIIYNEYNADTKETGKLKNDGVIISCAPNSELDGTITGNSPVTAHTVDEEGVCTVCGAKRAIIGVKEESKDKVNKVYDATTYLDMEEDDFEVIGAEEGANIEIIFGDPAAEAAAAAAVADAVAAGDAVATVGAIADAAAQQEDVEYIAYDGADVGEHSIVPLMVSLEYDEEVYRYFVDDKSFAVTGTISAFDIGDEDSDAGSIDVEDIDDQKYTGKEVKPTVKVTFESSYLDDGIALKQDKDFTVTYQNNIKEGTATATLKGMGNFTGTYKVEFEIVDESSGSGGSGDDDDDDDEDEEDEEDDDTGVLLINEENYGRVLFGRDYLPRPFDLSDEEIRNGVDMTDPTAGNIPKRLIIEPTAMENAEGETLYLDAEETRAKYETVHLRLTNEQIANLIKLGYVELVYQLEYARLRIPLELLKTTVTPSADGGAAEPVDVDMYDFCIEQVLDDKLSEREAAAVEGYQAVFPMYRVDVNAVIGEYPKPAKAADGDAAPAAEVVEPQDDPQYDTLIAPEADFVKERLEYVADIGASAQAGTSGEETGDAPEGCVSRVYFTATLLDRDADQLTSEQVVANGTRDGGVVEIYGSIHEAADRDSYLSKFDGTLFSDYHRRVGSCVIRLSCRLNDAQRATLEDEIVKSLTASQPKNISSGFSQSLPVLVPILDVVNAEYAPQPEPEAPAQEKADEDDEDEEDEDYEEDEEDNSYDDQFDWKENSFKLEILNDAYVEVPKGAHQLFVSGDATVSPEEGSAMTAVRYIEGSYDDYARVYPMAGGLYGVVASIADVQAEEDGDDEYDDDDDDDDDEDEDFGDDDDEADGEDAEPAADSETVYAYRSAANDGDMYWLVNTLTQTVEYYREDTGAYMIGDCEGSLKAGMTVTYRDNGSRVNIRLKYPQTYRFAVMSSNGAELQMEQQDAADVENIISQVR